MNIHGNEPRTLRSSNSATRSSPRRLVASSSRRLVVSSESKQAAPAALPQSAEHLTYVSVETILRRNLSFQGNKIRSKPTSRPSALEAHLGFWLRYVSNSVTERFETLLAVQGVSTSEWVALRTLFDRPATPTAELIEALGMTKGAASKVVSRLESKGLARRQLADGGAREQLLSLTRKGAALVPRLAALADRNEEHFFAHLSAADRRMLMAQFQGLVAHHRFKQLPVA